MERRRLGYHRLRESLEASTRASRGGPAQSYDPGRGQRSTSRDVRTAWVLSRDDEGRLWEIRGGYRGIAASSMDAAEKAIADVGGLPNGGVVIVRRGSFHADRSIAAYAAYRGEEWHGAVAPGASSAVELKQGAQLSTVEHLLARCRGQMRWLGPRAQRDPVARRRAIFGVVSTLDAASRQRAAQVLAPDTPQTGDVDHLALLVEAALDRAEEEHAAGLRARAEEERAARQGEAPAAPEARDDPPPADAGVF